MLTFSPILMVFIIMEVENRRKETIMEIENRRKETFNEQNYSYVDGVKFNKEKNELIKYSKNKKNTNYTIPNSVTSIGEGAFYGCSSLTNITIPDGVTSIRHTAFAGCENLTIITIPDSVTTIENLAFQSSKSLMSVTIGSGIMRIGEGVFQNCGNLKTVIFHGDAPKVGKNTFSNWGSASKVATVTIYRKPDAKGWGDTWGGRPVKLISETKEEAIAKSSQAEPAKGGVPVNSNLKFRIKGDAVTIIYCDEKASGALTIPATLKASTQSRRCERDAGWWQ